jgi:hypothetical protein
LRLVTGSSEPPLVRLEQRLEMETAMFSDGKFPQARPLVAGATSPSRLAFELEHDRALGDRNAQSSCPGGDCSAGRHMAAGASWRR